LVNFLLPPLIEFLFSVIVLLIPRISIDNIFINFYLIMYSFGETLHVIKFLEHIELFQSPSFVTPIPRFVSTACVSLAFWHAVLFIHTADVYSYGW
jgi:hypothetical protein